MDKSNTNLTMNKERFLKISKVITKLFNSELPMAILSFFIFFSWFFELEIVAFSLVIIYASVSLVFVDDTLPLMPAIILTTFTVADGINIVKYINFAYAAVVIVAALLFHMIYYRKKIRFGKMFLPQALVALALLLGGLGTISIEYYLGTLALNLLLGIGILLMYFLFYLYRGSKEGQDTSKYFSKMLSWAGIIVSLQILTYIFRSNQSITFLSSEFMDLGWGIDNNAATLLLITAPLTLYLATRKDSLRPSLYVLSSSIQYLAIILTFSRGGILFGFISFIISTIFLFKNSARKKEVLVTGCIILLIGALVVVFKAPSIAELIRGFTFQGTGDNGRFDLYKEAWDSFISHPIFGVGLGYQGSNYEIRSISFYFFHSTLFQIIACTGLFGLLAYSYLYFRRYQIVLKNLSKTSFALFSLIAMLGFEAYSMIDTGTFVPFPSMMLIMFLTMILEENLPSTGPLNDLTVDYFISKLKKEPVDSL